MNLEEAKNLLGDYGDSLAEFEKRQGAVSISSLPDSKENIKKAIKLVYLSLGLEESEEVAKMKGSLEVGFICLADFQSEEDAEVTWAHNESVAKAMEIEPFNPENIKFVNESSEILQKVKKELDELKKELDGFLVKTKKKPAKGK